MIDRVAENTARLEALEIMVAHQDRMLSELNDVVTSQWRKIDILERKLAQIREEFQSLGAQREGPEAPPPHY